MDTRVNHQVYELIEPVLDELGFELVEVKLSSGRDGLVLRVVIYKETGINLDDCSLVSREVGHLLEVEDPIHRPYRLEISSPGLDRPLATERDFARNMGKKVKVKFFAGEEELQVTGVVAACDDDTVELDVDDCVKKVQLATIIKAKLVIKF